MQRGLILAFPTSNGGLHYSENPHDLQKHIWGNLGFLHLEGGTKHALGQGMHQESLFCRKFTGI